jgi:hypothetical protein
MSALRFARVLLLLSPALLLLAAVGFVILKPTAPPPQGKASDDVGTGGGKLVVLVVFDQMRGDYLERWKHLYGADGFERMKREGAWYSNVRLPYAASSTAPGHASLVTGATPSVHGIVENRWFDRSRGKVVTAVAEEGIVRVPSSETATRQNWPGLSPRKLLAPTVGDTLKEHIRGARCVSLALKDRAAVLLGGQTPHAAFCFDGAVGEFHTSAHYRDGIPGWADEFDRGRIVHRWTGKTWDKIGPAAAYDALGADDQPGEAGRATFPHPLAPSGSRYFDSLEASPYGNELLWEFAKAAIAGEKLGRNGAPDLLCLGFSANDIVGHAFGPDSHEVLDITLRSDRLVADMIAHLNATLGPHSWAMVVTADHGVCPLPEVTVKTRPDARRLGLGDLRGLEEHLDKVFGQQDGVPGQWLERDASINACYPWLYLNRKHVDAMGLTANEVEAAAANWLRERPTPFAVFTRTEIERGEYRTADERRLGPLVKASFHQDRCGDLCLVHPAYSLVYDPLMPGTEHGTPHDYDRHIPILAYGAGVPKLGERTEPTSSLVVAPLLAKLLGVGPPKDAKEPLPIELAR